MAEGFDLSDIPLACDSHSELDSTLEVSGNPGSSRSQNDSENSEQNVWNGGDPYNDRPSFHKSDVRGMNSSKYNQESFSKDDFDIEGPQVTDFNTQENSKPVENGHCRTRTKEEMMLREFDLLDEVGPNDDNEKNNICDDYDNVLDCDDLLEDEIDAMLEEKLAPPPKKKPRVEKTSEPSEADSANNNGNAPNEEEEEDEDCTKKDKVVLVEKVKNHFEVLPDGWVVLTHNSGMPLYLHRPTRVCTLSKPYSLGAGSARKHSIPLSAIPCLEYRRAKEEDEKKKNAEPEKPAMIVNGTEMPNAKIETAQENEISRQVTPEQLTEYCKSLFEFDTIQVFRFKSWLARRKYKKKMESLQERPTLPKDTKLITCLIKQSNGYGKQGNTREWIMNPNGKSYVCILHEYVQRALKDQPVYTFKELENTATPYLATVSIGNIQYGSGYGSSKKQAKHDAAKATLEILIPEMKEKIDQDEKLRGHAGTNRKDTDLSFFDGIKVEDPRVTELCAKTTEPLPHEILLTCLQRNFGLSQTNIKYETTPLKHCKNEFKMTVGNHTATVICRNKRDGKQKASQAILQALHPHIPSWGSLLRLYGNTSVKSVKEKKIEEQEITLLQNRGNSHSPNYAILNKLKEEMKKFKAMKSAIKPIGKFVPPDDVELPAESGADLSNVTI